ncbi:hypothetical protein [Mycobacterium sp. 1164985.4]|nr:hypothetical protein [Mycobacterium sp. 1164985.4]
MTDEAHRNLRAFKLAEHVQKFLDGAPPLREKQRERIAGLLRAGGGAR